jgi:hypothetical protein
LQANTLIQDAVTIDTRFYVRDRLVPAIRGAVRPMAAGATSLFRRQAETCGCKRQSSI